MGALSMDLRIRAARAVDSGTPVRQVAHELQVSVRWVNKLIKQRRDGLGLEPQYEGNCGRPRKFTPNHEERLKQDVRDFPDATIVERIERLGLPIQKPQTWRWLKRLEFSHKKSRWWPASAPGRM